MKTAITLAVTIVSLTGIPLLAQDSASDANASSSANDSVKVTYAPAAGGFGDLAASHAWEMSAVTGELEGKLDSKTAKVGDRVVLKTTEKVQTSDGTVIPRGSRVVGHVTEVQAYDTDHGPARIAIAFDRVEPKNGQSIAVHTLIRSVSPNGMAANSMNDDRVMDMPMSGGGPSNEARMGGGQGTAYGRGGGVTRETGGLAGDTIDRTANAAASENDRANANLGSTEDSSTAVAGRGDLSADTGAHGVAAARARPHPTGIPGVMLAGNSSSSGVLLASLKNIHFESGTQIQLGVVADR
ncbi:MAG: hypothetical protein ABR865_07315 [Terracidiphilus sp.]|jgi:hypothetical protein